MSTSWAGPDNVFFSPSLASYLDNGLKLLGILQSFDQFANVVPEGACERVIVGDLYCDIPLGLYVIHRENVILIRELDVEEELPPHDGCVSSRDEKSECICDAT